MICKYVNDNKVNEKLAKTVSCGEYCCYSTYVRLRPPLSFPCLSKKKNCLVAHVPSWSYWHKWPGNSPGLILCPCSRSINLHFKRGKTVIILEASQEDTTFGGVSDHRHPWCRELHRGRRRKVKQRPST